MNGQFEASEINATQYFLLVAVVLGLMFCFVAPDDDLAYGWFTHALHWQVQTVLPMFLAILISLQLGKFKFFIVQSAWLKILLSGVLASILFCPIALLSDYYLANEYLTESISRELVNEVVAIGPPITLFWLAINAPFQLGWKFQKYHKTTKSPSQPKVPTFYSLLPESIHGDLLYLKSELHYVKVVTVNGEALILYSLQKAMSELGDDDGVHCHRSYWVKRDAVTSFEKKGREGLLRLSNGDAVPVSRNKARQIVDFISTS